MFLLVTLKSTVSCELWSLSYETLGFIPPSHVPRHLPQLLPWVTFFPLITLTHGFLPCLLNDLLMEPQPTSKQNVPGELFQNSPHLTTAPFAPDTSAKRSFRHYWETLAKKNYHLFHPDQIQFFIFLFYFLCPSLLLQLLISVQQSVTGNQPYAHFQWSTRSSPPPVLRITQQSQNTSVLTW